MGTQNSLAAHGAPGTAGPFTSKVSVASGCAPASDARERDAGHYPLESGVVRNSQLMMSQLQERRAGHRCTRTVCLIILLRMLTQATACRRTSHSNGRLPQRQVALPEKSPPGTSRTPGPATGSRENPWRSPTRNTGERANGWSPVPVWRHCGLVALRARYNSSGIRITSRSPSISPFAFHLDLVDGAVPSTGRHWGSCCEAIGRQIVRHRRSPPR